MSGMWGCTPAFVKGTDIDYTPQRQEIADFVEKYRVALEQRDFDTLKDMVSSNYYENASTTDTPEDDYGFTGFLEWSQKMKASIKAVKYSLKLLKIEVMEKNAPCAGRGYGDGGDREGRPRVWRPAPAPRLWRPTLSP